MQCSPTELIARTRGQNDISSVGAAPRRESGYFTRKRRSRSELLSTLTDDSAMATAA